MTQEERWNLNIKRWLFLLRLFGKSAEGLAFLDYYETV